MLLVAVWLRPSSTGLGTHQQLGLPPCGFIKLYGIPCPSCGMTTSWAHTVRGQLAGAWRANPGGMLLAVSAIVAVPWMGFLAVTGRVTPWMPRQWHLGGWGVTVIAVTLIDWVARMLR
jgi:hypothetical protein